MPLQILNTIVTCLFISQVTFAQNLATRHLLLTSPTCPTYFVEISSTDCVYRGPYATDQQHINGLLRPITLTEIHIDPRKVQLGHLLFFDPILSRHQDLACADCHHPSLAMADARPLAMGIGGRGVGVARHGGVDLARNTPALWNLAFRTRFFWDGHAHTLKDQMHGPLFNSDEMAASPELIEQRVSQVSEYKRLFMQVYGKQPNDSVQHEQIIDAIVHFEKSLISLDSAYDRYAHGDINALSSTAMNGLNIFRSFVARCSECHTPPLFTNEQQLIIGAPDHTSQKVQSFNVPSLRNVALTAPYMHHGHFATIDEVINFYSNGGGRTASAEPTKIHWHIHQIGLSLNEKQQLKEFLLSLTDIQHLPRIPETIPSGLRQYAVPYSQRN